MEGYVHSSMRSNDVHCVMAPHTPRAVEDKPRRALIRAVIFCMIMMCVEGICGFIANSLAVLSDAVHMLADVFALSISLFAVYASSWSATTITTYGWGRVEVVGALCSILTTWGLAGWIVFGAIKRTIMILLCAGNKNRKNCDEIDAELIFVVGVFGLLMNVVLAIILRFGGVHGHSHGLLHSGADVHEHLHSLDALHDHSHEMSQDIESVVIETECGIGNSSHFQLVTSHSEFVNPPLGDGHSYHCGSGSMNLRAAMLHVFGDCIQALGVVVAASIIWFGNLKTQGSARSANSYYNLADPFFSFLFGLITIYTTRDLFKEVVSVLLEEVPASVSYDGVRDALLGVENVERIDDLHMWSVGPNFHLLSAHLTVAGCSTICEAKELVEEAARRCKRLGLAHATIQLNHVSRIENGTTT
ncbi:zinc transporter [Trypanosoma cruzi]|uniref:Zinc transporter n=1 Tax=Trypanosoma cruzi Dm28c TaxID=1416333 RepID=V5BV32_TRYCR|nr:hypothetical protein TCDM_01160 [Trypanosoma cruzi Dm28c]RNF22337.1 zinc transporter [Trypanosoma cruzi]